MNDITISNEALIRFKHLNLFDKIVVQTYIIKILLKTTLTRDMIDDISPDHDIIYMVTFQIDKDKYKICHFMFKDESHGFITKNSKITFVISKDKVQIFNHNGDEIEDQNYNMISKWIDNKIINHKYLNLGSVFYLSN